VGTRQRGELPKDLAQDLVGRGRLCRRGKEVNPDAEATAHLDLARLLARAQKTLGAAMAPPAIRWSTQLPNCVTFGRQNLRDRSTS
jgi:hypothetical protein